MNTIQKFVSRIKDAEKNRGAYFPDYRNLIVRISIAENYYGCFEPQSVRDRDLVSTLEVHGFVEVHNFETTTAVKLSSQGKLLQQVLQKD